MVVAGQPDRYERLYAISHEDLSKLFIELAPRLLQTLTRVAWPLDVGVLDARRIGAVVGLHAASKVDGGSSETRFACLDPGS